MSPGAMAAIRRSTSVRYRLLGTRLFETDRDVLEHAAGRRIIGLGFVAGQIVDGQGNCTSMQAAISKKSGRLAAGPTRPHTSPFSSRPKSRGQPRARHPNTTTSLHCLPLDLRDLGKQIAHFIAIEGCLPCDAVDGAD